MNLSVRVNSIENTYANSLGELNGKKPNYLTYWCVYMAFDHFY